MKQSVRHCLLLAVEEDYLDFGARYAMVHARADGGVEADLSGRVGRERNIEEVGQAEVPIEFAMVKVGCLKVWRMLLAGTSRQAVSAPPVSTFLPQDSFFSLSQSSLLRSTDAITFNVN